jgi:hypothetical protein
LYKRNLTPDPSPAERGAVCPRLAPLSAGEGSGVRFWNVAFPKKKLLDIQTKFNRKKLTLAEF